jgi:sugar lactone lactonase YvrE
MKPMLTALAAFVATIISPAVAGEMQDGRCDGAVDENFICGPVNAEDLVKVPGSDWVLASRMAGPGVDSGAIYLLNVRDHSWRSLDLDAIGEAPDAAAYPACSGKPSAAAFRGHGLALDKTGDQLRLLAINHGGRESVEIFAVSAGSADEPTLTWIGCVPAPENAQLNTVVALPGGGLAVTEFFDASNQNWTTDLFEGKPTGSVLEWSAASGWTEVEGAVLSGPNGLAVSPDGRSYFVAEWGARRLHRFQRGASAEHKVVDVGVLADNLSWDEGGSLLLTGQNVADKREYAECALSDARVCPDAWKVLRIDPETLAMETIIDRAGTKEFGSATTALDLGTEHWIGTSRGERIAVIARQ